MSIICSLVNFAVYYAGVSDINYTEIYRTILEVNFSP